MQTCASCAKKFPDNRFQCPHCRCYQSQGGSIVAADGPGDGSILLCDVKSSSLSRMPTGPWDACFGTDFATGKSGICQSSVTLLAGSPGAGKSTLLLQVSNAVVELTGQESLYLASEEPLEQIKGRADRLGIDHADRIRMLSVMTGEGNVEDLLLRYKPSFLILDSLNGMAGSDMLKTIAVCKAVKQFCMTYKIAAIVTSHITKQGEIAGLEGLQHEVDATFTFFPDEDTPVPDGEEKVRILEVEKNRNGRAFISERFAMTEKGLELFIMNNPDEGEED